MKKKKRTLENKIAMAFTAAAFLATCVGFAYSMVHDNMIGAFANFAGSSIFAKMFGYELRKGWR